MLRSRYREPGQWQNHAGTPPFHRGKDRVLETSGLQRRGNMGMRRQPGIEQRRRHEILLRSLPYCRPVRATPCFVRWSNQRSEIVPSLPRRRANPVR